MHPNAFFLRQQLLTQMPDQQDQPYPWDGPDDDVIAETQAELTAGPQVMMKASNYRTNFVQTLNRKYNHIMHTDEPPDLSHSFKKGGRGEARVPSTI